VTSTVGCAHAPRKSASNARMVIRIGAPFSLFWGSPYHHHPIEPRDKLPAD
jgi:hypothetical protein